VTIIPLYKTSCLLMRQRIVTQVLNASNWERFSAAEPPRTRRLRTAVNGQVGFKIRNLMIGS